jgi:hypothetical protein
MNTLPNELVLDVINLLPYSNKRQFLRTSKIYFKLSPLVLKNVKYGIYEPLLIPGGDVTFKLIAICHTIEKCKELIKPFVINKYKTSRQPFKCFNDSMTIDNNFTLYGNPKKFVNYHDCIGWRCFGYIIDQIILDELIIM